MTATEQAPAPVDPIEQTGPLNIDVKAVWKGIKERFASENLTGDQAGMTYLWGAYDHSYYFYQSENDPEGSFYPIPSSINYRGEEHALNAENGNLVAKSATVSSVGVEMARRIIVGPNSTVSNDVHLGQDVELGSGVHVGPQSIIGTGAAIPKTVTRIGDFVSIEEDVQIGYGVVAGRDTSIFDGTRVGRYTIIGKRVKLDSEVTIGPNNNIGDGTTVNSFTVTNHKVSLGEGVAIGKAVKVEYGAEVLGHSRLDDGAQIGHSAKIGLRNVVSKRAVIGNRVQTEEDVHVGTDTTIGNDSRLLKGVNVPTMQQLKPKTIAVPQIAGYQKKIASYKSDAVTGP